MHKIAECVGWKKLWDHTLYHGPSVIKGMKNLVRVITYPDHLPNKCPLCDAAVLDKPTLAKHVITNHTKSDNSWCTLLDSLTAMNPTFFSHIYASCMSFNYCIRPSLCLSTCHALAGPFNMNFELCRQISVKITLRLVYLEGIVVLIGYGCVNWKVWLCYLGYGCDILGCGLVILWYGCVITMEVD